MLFIVATVENALVLLLSSDGISTTVMVICQPVSWYLQLRTGRFCWSKILLPSCIATWTNTFGICTLFLLSSATYTICILQNTFSSDWFYGFPTASQIFRLFFVISFLPLFFQWKVQCSRLSYVSFWVHYKYSIAYCLWISKVMLIIGPEIYCVWDWQKCDNSACICIFSSIDLFGQ